MEKIVTSTAPAKIILSGEHAIIYGAPAISLAINQRVATTVSFSENTNGSRLHNSPTINFNLCNLAYVKSHTLEKLLLLNKKLQNKYVQFLQGRLNIKEVIKKPFELLQFLVTTLIESLHVQISENLEVKVKSDIPIGAGFGSSAACIVSCLHSLAKLFKVTWEPKKFLNIANRIENLQHGNSSGLDLYTIMFGGCNYFPENFTNLCYLNNRSNNFDNIEQIKLTGCDFKIVNTGKPAASTGECVSKVTEYFIHNKTQLVTEFSQTTLGIKRALLSTNRTEFIEGVRSNHALLSQIGVVPEKIQMFIKKIEQAGGAGKICGAGSIYGDNAGIVMLVGDIGKINQIVADYGYCLQEITIDYNGVTVD